MYQDSWLRIVWPSKVCRMRDTVVCYIHKQSILTEPSLKAYYKIIGNCDVLIPIIMMVKFTQLPMHTPGIS